MGDVGAGRKLRLTCLRGDYSICRLSADHHVPAWATGELTSITRTRNELSIVCPSENVGSDPISRVDDGWRCLRFDGTFNLNETGVLASVVTPLAEAKISVFALATFDTDFVLVRKTQLADARRVLQAAGHTIRDQ